MPIRVAVDPGHGSKNSSAFRYDPGATGRTHAGETVAEADLVLKYALTLKDALLKHGAEVFLTRTSSADPMPLGKRAPFAKAHHCETLVSIHANASTSHNASGCEVWHRKNPTLADEVQRALVKATGLRDRGTKVSDRLAVLKFGGKAVLIELGFIDNPSDLAVLLNRDVRIAACEGIAAAVTGGELLTQSPVDEETKESATRVLTALQTLYELVPKYAPNSMLALNSLRATDDVNSLVRKAKEA